MQHIEIRVKGVINQQWSEWFGGLTISHPAANETVLSGLVLDQAAVYGVIARLRDLGLKLSWLSSEEIWETCTEGKNDKSSGGNSPVDV